MNFEEESFTKKIEGEFEGLSMLSVLAFVGCVLSALDSLFTDWNWIWAIILLVGAYAFAKLFLHYENLKNMVRDYEIWVEEKVREQVEEERKQGIYRY